MKVVVFNGALTRNSPLFELQARLEEMLLKKNTEFKTFVLKDENIPYCQGCFECWIKTPGLCKATGEGRHIAEAYVQSDLCVLLTPVTFGGYSSQLKKAMDMLLCTLSPFFMTVEGEVHHQKRYEHYPSLLGIGWLENYNPDQAQIFTSLVHRNAINFHAPKCAANVFETLQSDQEVQLHLTHLLDMMEV